MSFSFHPLEVPDVVLVRPTIRSDARGSFQESYRRSAFAEAGIAGTFVQDNVARSEARVLRGLHFQVQPAAQGKLVQVVRGAIFDVAVDLRSGSAWFGQWVGCRLDAASGDLLWIPTGFAHGYCTVSDEGADVHYKVTAEYDASLDRGIRYDDPTLAIEWPVHDPVVSERDRRLPALADVGEPFGA